MKSNKEMNLKAKKWAQFIRYVEAGKVDWQTVELVTGKASIPSFRSFNPKMYDKLKAEGKIIEIKG